MNILKKYFLLNITNIFNRNIFILENNAKLFYLIFIISWKRKHYFLIRFLLALSERQ